MKQADAGKLIQHIEEAKEWLDKAKDEFYQSNLTRGEMVLNLAQAEVRYAWELSRSHFVSHSKKGTRNLKIKLLLPAAASFIILGFVVLWLQSGWNPFTGKNPALVKNINSNKSIAFKDEAQLKFPVKDEGLIQSRVFNQPDSKSGIENEVTSTSDKMGDNSKVTVVSPKTAVSDPAGRTTVSGIVKENEGRETVLNQSTLQPVSQLGIDEDALTKIASHSLQNGK